MIGGSKPSLGNARHGWATSKGTEGSMRRRIVLGALLMTGALSLAVSAFQQPAGGRQGGGQQAAPSAAAL